MKKIISFFAVISTLICGIAFAEVDSDRTIKVNREYEDSLEEYSEIDYFNFDLSKQGSVQIEFEADVEGKYNVVMYAVDDDNKQIQSTTFYANYNTTSGRETYFANKLRLPAGEYRIKVSGNNSNFSDEYYNIQVNYSQESKGNYEVETNNTAIEAMEIEPNETITGNLQASSDIDYYMIELPYDGRIQVNFEYYYKGAYNVTLYRIENNSLKEVQTVRANTQIKPYANECFNQVFDKLRVPAGTYYIKVSSATYCNNDYNLNVFYSIERYGNFEREINDEARNATEIYNNVEWFGNLNSNRDIDYYVAYIDNGELKLQFEIPQNAKYSVAIYKETIDGKLVSVANKEVNSENTIIDISDINESGRYYFKVSSRTYSNEDYKIKYMNNLYTPIYPIATTIYLQIGNKYMTVNDVQRLIDNNGTTPVLKDGRTMLPIRAVIEALGGSIEWDANAFATTVKIGNKNIYIKIGEKVAYVNGTAKKLDVASTTINGRTMLPLRFVMENLGGNVTWDDNTQRVKIVY